MAKQPAKGRKPPAKPRKTTQSRRTTAESAKVAKPEVDVIPAEVHKKTAAVPVKPDVPASDAKKPVAAESAKTPVSPPVPKPQPARQNASFIPLVLGGLIAGGIGFGIAMTTRTQGDITLSDQIVQQGAAIASLEMQVANPPVVDLSNVEAAQSALTTELANQQ